ncbi:MAG: hypothetical protein ACTSRW_03325 [Candidatus Helarchaeota archaeon]
MAEDFTERLNRLLKDIDEVVIKNARIEADEIELGQSEPTKRKKK